MVDLFTTDRKFLHVDEVAEMLDVSRRTVYYWIATGKVEYIQILGSKRISVSDLRRRLRPATTDQPLSFHYKSVQPVTRSA